MVLGLYFEPSLIIFEKIGGGCGVSLEASWILQSEEWKDED